MVKSSRQLFIAPAPSAFQVMDVYVLPASDIPRGNADGLPVFHDEIAFLDVPDRKFVTEPYPFRDANGQPVAGNRQFNLRMGIDIPHHSGHIVGRFHDDYDRSRHIPLSRFPL
jgi:hypothetical protein